jgi:hypothetical protein
MNPKIECQYCGNKWEHAKTWERPKCSICSESKLLVVREPKEHNGDVFGYRFSKPFPEKKDAYRYWSP